MRIAVVTTSYPEREGDPAGHFVQAHARALAREGAEVLVFAPGTRPPRPIEGHGEGRVRVIGFGGTALFGWPGAVERARAQPLRLLAAPPALLRAARSLRSFGPFDRAVAHWLLPCAFPLLEGIHVPIEVVAHGADVRLLLSAPGVLRAAIVARLLDRGARLTFVARRLLLDLTGGLPEHLASRLLREARVEAAPIDVPARETLADPRAILGLAPGTSYVAWVGRVVGSKRPGLAVAAAHAAGMALVVAGDGPDLQGLRDQRAGADPRAPVVLVGRLPRHQALAIVAQASALLHTSVAEGAPTAVREARALGVPVVACAAGDVETWATLDDGIHVTEATVPAIAEALRRAVARQSVVVAGGQR